MAIKDKARIALENFRIFHKVPTHIHTFKDVPDMIVKECVVCHELVDNQDYGIAAFTSPAEQDIGFKPGNVPTWRKRRSGGLYEAHKANIRMVLDKHGVLVDDGWGFYGDGLVEDLAGVK